MSDKDTLPPTQPDVPDSRSGSRASGDQPTLQAGGSGDRPAQRETESPGQPEDRTVLIGDHKPGPVLAWLVITDGGPVGTLFTLEPDVTSIGREPANDVVLEDDACSGQHAKIRVERENEEEQFHLLDLASTNGTFVNDEQVYRHQLTDGERITIGETELVFKRV